MTTGGGGATTMGAGGATKTGGGPLGWKEGWTPLAIADGVFYANTFKRSPETADLLRRLMQERGLSVEVRK